MSHRINAVRLRQELQRAGYQQGQIGTTSVDCEDCGKNASGKRGWWKKVSYEYDEWECLCKNCAYAELHKYDDFDFDLYESISIEGQQ